MPIRSATTADAADISALVLSLARHYTRDGEETLPDWLSDSLSVQAMTEHISHDDNRSFVYVKAEKIVGYIGIKAQRHIYHLFVHEGVQRQGLGRILWERALAECDTDIITVRSSLNAVPIYLKFGFGIEGPVMEKEGIYYQSMEYRKIS